MKAINQSTAPKEKNQNSCPAHNRWVMVARAKTVKKVWVRIAQYGSRKSAMMFFNHRVGTVRGAAVCSRRAAIDDATFIRRAGLRLPVIDRR